MTMKHLNSIHRRKSRTRFKLSKSGRMRLCVVRSNLHIYAQIIDDSKGITLVSASSIEPAFRAKFANGGNAKAAEAVGMQIAQRAQEAGIQEVVFDRGSRMYHGCLRSLAEAARSGGLRF